MASICSKVIILFMLACMSTLSSANEGWFRGRNCSLPFKPRHKHPRSPPPPSRRLPQPPRRRLPPSPPPSRRLPSPPSRRLPPPPPPSRRPRTPPSHQLPPTSPPSPPPSRRPRTPPPRQLPSPPPPSRRPRTPPPSPSPPSPCPSPTPQTPKKIIVGGSQYWRLGFDYNNWALKNGPFYINDVLVFKYDPPNSSTPPHNVYLLPNMQSFINCDLGRAKMVANLTQGSGNGFEFVLKQQNPYYFACGEGNGFHCNSGSMKFSITPQSMRLPLTPPSLPSPRRRPRTPPSRQVPPPPPSLSPPPPSSSPPPRKPRTPPSRQVPPPPPSLSLPPPPPLLSPPPPSPSPSPPPPPSPSPSPTPSLTPQSPRKIIVGGSEHWRLSFDYNDWALKNGPFYLNDILVFKYDRPNSSTPPHSIYLLPNMQSFVNCDFGRAKMVANLTQGSGDGFEFVLNQQNPYYFACGEGNGFHCKIGSMKFSVTPIVQG